MRHGWPPDAFHSRGRARADETTTLAILAWTAQRLFEVSEDAAKLARNAVLRVKRQLAALQQLRASGAIGHRRPGAPTDAELASLRHEGYPWSVLTDVARALRILTSRPAEIAFELLRPDPEMAPLLFHLGVLGTLLVAAVDVGARVTSLRPIASGRSGPVARITDPLSGYWDVWFEAGGIWRTSG
ncbi:MAG TPA: hypothetical protein VF911_12370, partial [Thermoanaerobaculia bacterium]